MSCPMCQETDKQYYHAGHPANRCDPPEPAGYTCGYCQFEYSDDPAAAADQFKDALYEDPRYWIQSVVDSQIRKVAKQ